VPQGCGVLDGVRVVEKAARCQPVGGLVWDEGQPGDLAAEALNQRWQHWAERIADPHADRAVRPAPRSASSKSSVGSTPCRVGCPPSTSLPPLHPRRLGPRACGPAEPRIPSRLEQLAVAARDHPGGAASSTRDGFSGAIARRVPGSARLDRSRSRRGCLSDTTGPRVGVDRLRSSAA
jgi:hypothetical protein